MGIEILTGTSFNGRWSRPPRRISLEQASSEIAAAFNCTPEEARDSLLRHNYASGIGPDGSRDWRIAGMGYDEEERW